MNTDDYSMEIPGTERTTFEIIIDADFYEKGTIITSSGNNLKVIHKKRCDRGVIYLCLVILSEEEFDSAVRHFRFLLKHGIL